MAERAPLRLDAEGGPDADAGRFELGPSASAEVVVAERGEERRLRPEPGQLQRRDRAAAARLRPGLGSVNDLAGPGHRLDPGELDPLHVADHGYRASTPTLTDAGRSRVYEDDGSSGAIPPFERFYVEHREVVLGFLRRRLPREAAEDAFQETFLRALRAYDRLEHGEHLRAWVLTIAARIAIDTGRRTRPPAQELPELPVVDGRPAYAEIEHLAGALPPTERAAVVLRYAYDLAYDDIAAALGSSPEAARQAASSGIRRLRAGGETG